MRVIVVGAGEVGSHIAESLSVEGVDVVVIEKNAKRLNELAQNVNVLAIHGSGINPNRLEDAGINHADMLLAVTASDEVNMTACLFAAKAQVPHRIVRIENDYLRGSESQDLRDTMKVDVIIDPDQETADAILGLLDYPGIAEIAELGKGNLIMLGAKLNGQNNFIGRKLAEIAEENEPEWSFIIGAISKGDETIIPRGDQYQLEEGDTVRLICKKEARDVLLKNLGVATTRAQRVMILGGGRIGEMTAKRLVKEGSSVTLVEWNMDRAEELSSLYDNINVIQGDITDPDLLDEEGIERMDAVVAVTGQDESNVLACLYAKSKNVNEIISTLHRLELKNMFRQIGLEKTLSPITASIEPVLKLVRSEKIKTTVQQVTTFLAMDIEVLELTIDEGSKADGMTVTDLSPSKKILIGAVVNDKGTKIVRGNTKLSAGDHLVVFARPQALGKVSKLFETKS